MKITKKQLKRIIAEEHRLVYGTKKPRRVKGRKTTARRKTNKQYLSEARRELIIEQRSIAFSNQLNELGLGTMLKGLGSGIKKIAGGAASKSWEKMQDAGGAIAGAAETAYNAATDAMEEIGGAIGGAAEDMGKTISKSITNELTKKIEEMTKEAMSRLQKEFPDKDEKEIKAFVLSIVQHGRAEATKQFEKGNK